MFFRFFLYSFLGFFSVCSASIEQRVEKLEKNFKKFSSVKKEEKPIASWRYPLFQGRGYAGQKEESDLDLFKNMSRRVGYLWCDMQGRLVKIQTSGTQVANIFAELQRRCLVRKGTPLAFAIKIGDF